MSTEELRRHRNAKPFTPFEIIMNDGTSIFVELPTRMTISPSGRMATVFVKNDLEFVVVEQVAALKPREQTEPSAAIEE